MPEGDALHRAAERLRPLVGHVVTAESLHGRAQVLRIAERIDGKRLERVEAIGKNLLFSFEGGLVVRSHLRMKGRWQVGHAGEEVSGKPWLILRGGEHKAVLWNGSILEVGRGAVDRLGPDIMFDPPDLDAMIARLRRADRRRELGEVLLSQRLVAGIGNKWKAEGLFLARLSPWLRLEEASDDDLRRVLAETAGAMRSGRPHRAVYRRAGLPCRRCGTSVASWPQGDAARTAYWCPSCQPPAAKRGDQAGTMRARA